MASLEDGFNGENVDQTGTVGDFKDMEADLKREKFRTKSNFTKAKNKVLFLIDKQENPSHSEIQDACLKMDDTMESAMDVMTNLSELYVRNKENSLIIKYFGEAGRGIFSHTFGSAAVYQCTKGDI